MKMLKKNYCLLAAILISSSLVSFESDDGDAAVDTVRTLTASTKIVAKNSSGISGTVTFSETDGIVSMTANVSGLSAGKHAIHIHAIGDCSADDGTSAGGHWNPSDVDHGVGVRHHFIVET